MQRGWRDGKIDVNQRGCDNTTPQANWPAVWCFFAICYTLAAVNPNPLSIRKVGLFALAILIPLGATGYGGYLYGHSRSSAASGQAVVSTSAPQAFKKDYFKGEIPSNWSLLSNGQGTVYTKEDYANMGNILQSFAPSYLQFSDFNRDQVNFYVVSKSVFDEVMTHARENGAVISEGHAGTMPATIITYPGDGSDVEHSGGTTYFISDKETALAKESYHEKDTYLQIDKEFIGKPDFESAFQHYLDTADFSKGW